MQRYVGEGLVAVDCEKKTFLLNTLYLNVATARLVFDVVLGADLAARVPLHLPVLNLLASTA